MVSNWSRGIGMMAAAIMVHDFGRMEELEDHKSRQTYNDGLAKAARKEEPRLKTAEAKRKRKAERLKREAKNWR